MLGLWSWDLFAALISSFSSAPITLPELSTPIRIIPLLVKEKEQSVSPISSFLACGLNSSVWLSFRLCFSRRSATSSAVQEETSLPPNLSLPRLKASGPISRAGRVSIFKGQRVEKDFLLLMNDLDDCTPLPASI